MRKDMDLVLYKFEVIRGKEAAAEEWLAFLRRNKKAGEETLQKEHAYLEAYFRAVEDGTMYVYLFLACEDIHFSNDQAMNHGSDLDKQHFAYMKECVNLTGGDIMECVLSLNNLKDAIR